MLTSVLTVEPCRLLLITPFKATLPLCDIALFKKVNTRWVLMNTHWLYMLDCPAPILNIINKGLIKWEVGGGRWEVIPLLKVSTPYAAYVESGRRGKGRQGHRKTGDKETEDKETKDRESEDRETGDSEIGRETSKETRYRETERREKGR